MAETKNVSEGTAESRGSSVEILTELMRTLSVGQMAAIGAICLGDDSVLNPTAFTNAWKNVMAERFGNEPDFPDEFRSERTA